MGRVGLVILAASLAGCVTAHVDFASQPTISDETEQTGAQRTGQVQGQGQEQGQRQGQAQRNRVDPGQGYPDPASAQPGARLPPCRPLP